MTRFLIVAACLVFPCLVFGAAADSTSTGSAQRNSLQGGMWAMQFDINGQLLSVDSFAGGLSLKRQFTSKSAVRFGVGIGGASQFRETIQDGNPQNSSDTQGASIEAVYQRYWNPQATVNAYWTVGPTASYSQENSEQLNNSFKGTSEQTFKSVGGVAALGAEWFAVRQFSFHAEYSARGSYQWQESSSTGYAPNVPPLHRRNEQHGWSLGTSNAVRLGLSVYF